jgi:hypothetical protein
MRFQDLKLGQRVVTAEPSRLFASCNDGKIGTVTEFDEGLDRVWLEFADGSKDYGLSEDVTLIPEEPELFIPVTVKEKLDQIDKLVSEIRAILY